MKLTVVGSAPAYSLEPGRASSCYLVEHGGSAVVLDFGQGAFGALAAYRSPESVDAVCVSHLHADHCVDLVPLRHFVKYERGGRGPALYGPPELRGRFDAFQVQEGFFDDLAGGALERGSFRVGELEIEARPVTHIPDSFAFRVSPAGESNAPGLVYSGDCGAWRDLLPLIRKGDTLLGEAALGVGGAEGGPHLTAGEAASAARDGGAARLVLTHVLERNDADATLRAARDVYAGEISMASPGLTAEL